MILPSEQEMDIPRLARVYDNTTAPYKFYWFVSIINRLAEESKRREFSFDEIISGMIAEAWYPIHYFMLSFGKNDSLADIVYLIRRILLIPVDADKRDVMRDILKNRDIPDVRKCIQQLSTNVPYWFLSPWLPGMKKTKDVELASQSEFSRCPYAINGKSIRLRDEWAEYFFKHASILKDFSFWNLSLFLQKRNPNVPDLPSKLVRPLQRSSLTKQHHFWDHYIETVGEIRCIYTNASLRKSHYDLDHFIPWSFVAHDLLWNLLPADSSINSSKSNNLPPLDVYLKPMAHLQRDALSVNYANNPSDKLLEDYLIFRCSIEELISIPEDRFIELYKKEFTPMSQTAMNMGFAMWDNRPELYV